MVGRKTNRHTYEFNTITERRLARIKRSGLFRSESEAVSEAISILDNAIQQGEYSEEGHVQELE
jgi:hypothetical protein